MKKLQILLILLIISFVSYSQVQSIGTTTNTIQVRGKLRVDSTVRFIKVAKTIQQDTTLFKPVVIDSLGNLASSKYWGGSTTAYNIQTVSSGIKTFTFINVPVSYTNYIISVNGVIMRPGIDFTQSVNDITIPTITDGEYVEYRRIK